MIKYNNRLEEIKCDNCKYYLGNEECKRADLIFVRYYSLDGSHFIGCSKFKSSLKAIGILTDCKLELIDKN